MQRPVTFSVFTFCVVSILLNADIVLWNLIKVPWCLEFSPIAWWEAAASCALIYIYTPHFIYIVMWKNPGGDNCHST